MKVSFVYMNNECNVGRGAAYVAAAVRRAGHAVSFLDTFFTPSEAAADQVAAERPDVLMISTMTMLFPESLRLIRQVKAKANVPVLIGGIHPTIVGTKLLEENPEIDFSCVGEGESMVPEFLSALGGGDLAKVRNLVFRKNGTVVANPVGPPEDLAKVPEFPWEYFPPRAVVQEGQGFLYVNASRGCPFRCSYCCNEVYLKAYGRGYLRLRPIEHVVRELHELKDRYNPKLFYFGDEMILFDQEYARHLFGEIRRELKVPYGCMGRVEYLNVDCVSLLAETGCRYVGIGVECGDEEFRRKHLRRGMSNDQIRTTAKLLKLGRIFFTTFNMIGYPFDFDDRLTEATVRLTEEMAPDYVQFSIFYPFPGTDLHDYCVTNGLIDPEKLASAKDYFEDSVLLGVSLREKKEQLHRQFNPSGFLFDGTDGTSLEELMRSNEDLQRKLDDAKSQISRRTGVRGGAKEIARSVIRRAGCILGR